MVKDYAKLFEHIVTETANYVTRNKLQAMVLGISGGIDSTVCAAICQEVSNRTGVPLIGRSLSTKHNKEGEINAADLVGNAFCNSYMKVDIQTMYTQILYGIGQAEHSCMDMTGNVEYDIHGEFPKQQTPIANGNIQARLRMIYLYNLASIHKGFVIDTDNRTENLLGYWTLHGDVGDFKPIGDLWKTEVFKLAEWLFNTYKNNDHTYLSKAEAVRASLQLKPTAGLGITSNDLEELGAESYDQVDGVLQEFEAWQWLNFRHGRTFTSGKEERDAFLEEQQMLCYPIEVIVSVIDKYYKSTFKRMPVPLIFVNELV
jgi:NAD+ synthetase